MKSIREIAEIAGVSKTAVRKRIDNLGLQTSLQKNGNQFSVSDDIANSIIETFSKKPIDNQSTTGSQTNRQPVREPVVDLVSVLKEELDQKNREIETLHRLLDQEQQLRMISEKKVLEIEQKEEKHQVETAEKSALLYAQIADEKNAREKAETARHEAESELQRLRSRSLWARIRNL